MHHRDAETALDSIETLLAYALTSHDNTTVAPQYARDESAAAPGSKATLVDQGTLLNFKPWQPANFYTFDAMDRDRLYTDGAEYLVFDAHDLVGPSGLEVTLERDQGSFMWTGYRWARSRPKGLAVVGGMAARYLEVHQRFILASGQQSYFRRVIPVSAKGRFLGARIHSHVVCGRDEIGYLHIAASAIEDAYRAGAILVTLSADKAVSFPIAMGGHLELLKLRDAPLTSAA